MFRSGLILISLYKYLSLGLKKYRHFIEIETKCIIKNKYKLSKKLHIICMLFDE